MQKLPDRVPFSTHFPPISTPFSFIFLLVGTFSYIFHDVLVMISHFSPFPPISPHFPPFPAFFRGLLDTRVLRIWILFRLVTAPTHFRRTLC